MLQGACIFACSCGTSIWQFVALKYQHNYGTNIYVSKYKNLHKLNCSIIPTLDVFLMEIDPSTNDATFWPNLCTKMQNKTKKKV